MTKNWWEEYQRKHAEWIESLDDPSRRLYELVSRMDSLPLPGIHDPGPDASPGRRALAVIQAYEDMERRMQDEATLLGRRIVDELNAKGSGLDVYASTKIIADELRGSGWIPPKGIWPPEKTINTAGDKPRDEGGK